MAVIVVTAVGGFTLGAVVSTEPCQVESAYYCMRVEHDPFRASGRILWLDDLHHSYVDLADPDAPRVRLHALVRPTRWTPPSPTGERARRAAHRVAVASPFRGTSRRPGPGRRSTVLEIDPAVLDLGRDELGLRTSPAPCRCGSATPGSASVTRPDDSRDLVVGDAFGSLSVPWHLTTREFVREIDRVLRPGRRLRAERDRLPVVPLRAGGARDAAASASSTSPRSRHAPSSTMPTAACERGAGRLARADRPHAAAGTLVADAR